MPLVTENLNRGVVSVRDASLLAPGEVQQADECVYRLNDASIYGRPGRTAYNSSSTIKDSTGATCPVKGLAFLPFGGTRTDQLLALGGDDNNHGTLWSSDFTSIAGSATWNRVTGPGQVTDAVINNSTTVTSASGGFANMIVGASIQGTGIPVGAFVTAVGSATSITISLATTGGLQTVTATFDAGIAVSPDDTGTEVLTSVQWGVNQHYIAGSGTLRAVTWKIPQPTTTILPPVLIARGAGLFPVIKQPTAAVVAGTWPANLGNGYYWFVITEIYHPDQTDEIEGTYVPPDVNNKKLGPVVAQITSFSTQTIQLTFPAVRNNGIDGRVASHWGIYMSPKQTDGLTVPSLATFRRVATTPITATTLTLTDTSASTNTTQTKSPTVAAAFGARPQFTNPSRMLGALDTTYATASGATAQANLLQTFGFSISAPFNVTVTGVSIRVLAGKDAGNRGEFMITLRTTGGKTTPQTFIVVNSLIQLVTLGGQFDTWGVAWSSSDFADGTFEVVIEEFANPLRVYGMEVTVYYSGGNINMNGKPFRVVTYRDTVGFTIDEPARLPPPAGTTIAVFEGSIVSNDVGQPDLIRWSLPGEPEAWPSPYQMSFNGGKDNRITCIRRLNNILIVASREFVERVNYLPSEIDTDPRQGLAHEPITEDHGIAGPLAAVRFTRPGSGTYLAYVSYSGIHMTDGVTSNYLTRDIRISSYIDPNYIGKCVFRNYSKEQWLVLFYTPVGATKNTKALIFSYDQPKEDGSLRVVGPISVSARSAADATLNGVPLLLTGHSFGGKVWVEDQGVDLTGYTIDGSTQLVAAPSIITRRFYPAGIDRNARVEKQYTQHASAGTATNMTTVVMTAGSTTLTRAAGWTGITKGMRIVHTNMPGDSIVTNVSGTNLTASQAAFETVTGTVAFDTGTFSLTLRGQNIGGAVANIATTYASMLSGGLTSTALDGHAQAYDMKIEKVRLPDDTLFDLNTALQIHHFTYDVEDAGKEQSRSGAL